MKKAFLIPLMLAIIFYALPVLAVPLLINFQGKLTDSNNVPIGSSADVTADVTFTIYDVSLGGTPLWTETHFAVDGKAVTVSKGIFNVLIGDGTPYLGNTGDLSTILTGEDRWLEVQIGADPAMTPRQQITSVAYSIRSNSAANAADVLGKGINPLSVTITNEIAGTSIPVIDSTGKWVGDPTGLVGPPGPGFEDSSTVKICGRASDGLFGDFIIPVSWSNNTCHSSCNFGWQRWSTWLLYNGGAVSAVVPWTNC